MSRLRAADRRPTFHSAGGRPVLELSGVTVEYGGAGMSRETFRAVDDVSFTIARGRSLGLVGESGCGKTSLGRAVVGLTPLSGGTISIAQQPGTEGARFSRRLARAAQMVFQDPYSSLDPRQRIRDAVTEPMTVHGIGDASERAARADELLARVGLDRHTGDGYPHELSGGQRQRVCIARALAVDPHLVVCDEPTSALDVSIQAQVVTLLQELQADAELTYLFITHDLALLPQLVSDVAVMYLGRLVELGPADAVLLDPVHPYTVSLIESVPQLGVPRAAGGGYGLAGEATTAAELGGCRFRPRCWRYAELDGAGRSLCESAVPSMQPAGSDHHLTACHHHPTDPPPVTRVDAPRRASAHDVA